MENTAQKKLPLKVKWLFASGDFAKTLLVVITAVCSLYFYVDVLGMDPDVVALIILIAKIWDFINDPMMGAIVDRTRSKEGKCRMWLKYMSVPGGVVFALNFIMPELAETGKIVWVAITYTLQGMASTALMIPQNTLMSRITTDPVERAAINSYRGYFTVAANLVGSSGHTLRTVCRQRGHAQRFRHFRHRLRHPLRRQLSHRLFLHQGI